MKTRPIICGIATFASLWLAQSAFAQATAPAPGPVSENELRNTLIWNSPWEGRAAAPGRAYSYRTVFHMRRDEVVAEVVSYATNQRSDSVVDFRNGRLNWQDANGADVSVALADGGDLIGTAMQQNVNVPIVLRPRR